MKAGAVLRVGEDVVPLSVDATAASGTLRAHVELLGDRAAPFPLPAWATKRASHLAAALCEAKAVDLGELSLGELSGAARVASFLEISPEAMKPLVEAFCARLRGKSTAELCAALFAAGHDPPEQSVPEELFTPPASVAIGAGALPRLMRASNEQPAIVDEDEDALHLCLSRLDAATLRSLKEVSPAWQQLARSILGNEHSAWRQAPVWSVRDEIAALAEQGLDNVAVLRALGEAADAAVELPAFAERIVSRLGHEQAAVRHAAIELMGQLEPATFAQYALPIISRLDDVSRDVRRAAAAVIGTLGPAALEEHAAAIAGLLEHPEWDVRWVAVHLLGTLPPPAFAPHTLSVAARLDDSDGYVRMEAIEIFETIDGDALGAIAPLVVSWLVHAERVVRELAVVSLPRVPPEAVAPHAADFRQGLAHEDIDVRQVSLEMLERLDPALLVCHAEAIAERLEDTDVDVRRSAATALHKLNILELSSVVVAAIQRHDRGCARWLAARRFMRGVVPAGLCMTLAIGARWYLPSTVEALA